MQKSTAAVLFLLISWATCDGPSPNRNTGTRQTIDSAAGCDGGLSSDDGGQSADPDGAPADFGPAIADQGIAPLPGDALAVDHPPAAKPDLAGPKADSKATPKPDQAVTPPPPPPPLSGTLPTWVPLDWNAFPTDPGPNYAVTGKTWVVKTSGNDSNPGTDAAPLRTIAAALGKAQPGDLVRVHGGSYAEGTPGDYRALLMTKDNVILTAAAGEKVTVTPAAGYKTGLVMQGSKLVVNGINLSGFNPSIVFGSSSATQTNLVISNLTVQAPSGGFTDGIVDYANTVSKGFPNIKGLLIKNVTVLGASLSISCNSGPCSSWRLENVTVAGGEGSSGGSGADAIAVENGDNLLFYKVDVSGASADGIDCKATRVVVWDSHVHHVARNGVKLWYGGDVVNSCIHNTGADCALNVKGGDRIRILHSTIAFHNYGGGTSYNMTIRYDDNGPIQVDIVNSIIYNTSGGSYFSNNAKLNIENSLFYGIGNGVILDWGGVHIAQSEGAAAFAAKGIGSGNLVANPGLDAEFHQQNGSVVINKGKVLSGQYPTEDLDGKPRVKGGLPDIGPFEDF